MQKWAYARLVVENVSQLEPTVVNRSPNLNLAPDKEAKMGDGLDKWLKYLGRNGWELVGVLSNGDVGQLLFRTPH
jgi:hypothetical protein